MRSLWDKGERARGRGHRKLAAGVGSEDIRPSRAGLLAAILLVETAVVERGRVVVVPYGNPLALRPDDRVKTFETPTGTRRIPYGDRRSLEPLHEEDPGDRYVTPAGSDLEPREGRNLNRVWPGRRHGSGTERIADAIVRLMNEHEADLALDLHETRNPWGDLAWTLAARSHDDDFIREICERVNAAIGLDLMKPRHLDRTRGLSTLEWAPATGARSLLTETVRENATPIATRVALQIENVIAAAEVFSEEHPERQIILRDLPRHAEIEREGLGGVLQPLR